MSKPNRAGEGRDYHSQTVFYFNFYFFIFSCDLDRVRSQTFDQIFFHKKLFGADENLTERRVTSQVIPMAIRAFAFVRYDSEATGKTTARNLEYSCLNLILDLCVVLYDKEATGKTAASKLIKS